MSEELNYCVMTFVTQGFSIFGLRMVVPTHQQLNSELTSESAEYQMYVHFEGNHFRRVLYSRVPSFQYFKVLQ